MVGKRYNTIQGYRFLLFLIVFLFHCGSALFSIGWLGVQAFLVLSSFFLTSKLAVCDDIHFGSELKHRITRLYPPYILLMIGCVALSTKVYHRIPDGIPFYLLSAQNFYWTFFGWNPMIGFGHTWYMTLDVYLFILWIIVIKFTPKDRLLLISYFGIAFSVLYRVVCNLLLDNSYIAYTLPFGQLDSYCIGSVLALRVMSGKTDKKYAVIDTIIGIAGIIACMIYVASVHKLNAVESYLFFAKASNYVGDPIAVNLFLFVGILSAGLFRFCIDAKLNSFLSNKWMVKLGDWSYALFLFHMPFVILCMKIIKIPWLIAAITLPLTILSAYIWHTYLEQRIVKIIGK